MRNVAFNSLSWKFSIKKQMVYYKSKLSAISFSSPEKILACLGKNTMAMLIKILSWLRQPKVWRFVCSVSSVVGLFCYGFSSSFNHLFGKWSWWKILLYIFFSFIVSLAVLFAKERSSSSRMEAHTTFLVLLITCIYSFFFDKEVKGKPDAYSLISFAAFAIMSLGLSRLSHFGFEIDLLYFFSGVLTVQLMKVKLWLVVVGGSFSYSLIILRSTLDPHPRSGYHGLEDRYHVDIEIGSRSHLRGTNRSAPQVDSLQAIVTSTENDHLPIITVQEANDVTVFNSHSQGNTDRDSGVMTRFMGCIEALKKENESIISMISIQIDQYLKANVLDEDQTSVPELHRDDNLLVDSLSSGVINDLHENVKQMVLDGFNKECIHIYCSCRREFLKESLWTFGLQFQELDTMKKIESWIKALNVAARILFPNERKLCDRVFKTSISSRESVFTKVCTELVTSLLNTGLALENWSHFIRNTLQKLIQEFESCTTLINIAVVLIRRRLRICDTLENVSLVPDGGLHPIIFEVMYYIYSLYKNKEMSKLCQGFEERNISVTEVIARMRELLESKSSLEGNSKNYNKFEVRYYICSVFESRDSKLSHGFEEGKLSLPVYMARMIKLLESSLEANSKNYNDPALGYIFIMNNRRFIELEAKLNGLEPCFGDDWLQKNTAKFQQYLELYQRSSWDKIVNFLKLDINESEPNVVAELMKDKLYWFNEHFDEICSVQSEWSVCDEELREQIIKSIENILLPAYGNFLGKFQEFQGKHAYEYIKYGLFDVQDRLNNLFLEKVHESDTKREGKFT